MSPAVMVSILAADSSVAMWLPCVCTTPFGGPVVPEV